MQRRLAVLVAAFALLVAPTGNAQDRDMEEADASSNIRLLQHVTLEEQRASPMFELAFEDDFLVAGLTGTPFNDPDPEGAPDPQGFGLYRILKRPPFVKELAFYSCGSYSEVGIWGHLVFQGAWTDFLEPPGTPQPRSGVCDNSDAQPTGVYGGMEGLRIIDISNPRRPTQVGFVESVCGIANSTLVPSGKDLYIYNGARCNESLDNPYLTGNYGEMEVFKIDVDRPARSKVVSTPSLVSTESHSTVQGCYDMTIFPERDLAACLSFGSFLLLDISDPVNPKPIGREITVPGAANLYASQFSWDGQVLVMTDAPQTSIYALPCSGGNDGPTPRVWFYDIEDAASPTLLSTWGVPETSSVVVPSDGHPWEAPPQCNPVTVQVLPTRDPSRRLASIAHSGAGIWIIDFTDPADIKEIAYYIPRSDRPHFYASYWYNGRVYATSLRGKMGLRVFEVDGLDELLHRYPRRLNVTTQVGDFDE